MKDVQKFLGLANYYRQFVKDFVKVAKSLHEITRKEIKWNWEERQQKMFEKLNVIRRECGQTLARVRVSQT